MFAKLIVFVSILAVAHASVCFVNSATYTTATGVITDSRTLDGNGDSEEGGRACTWTISPSAASHINISFFQWDVRDVDARVELSVRTGSAPLIITSRAPPQPSDIFSFASGIVHVAWFPSRQGNFGTWKLNYSSDSDVPCSSETLRMFNGAVSSGPLTHGLSCTARIVPTDGLVMGSYVKLRSIGPVILEGETVLRVNDEEFTRIDPPPDFFAASTPVTLRFITGNNTGLRVGDGFVFYYETDLTVTVWLYVIIVMLSLLILGLIGLIVGVIIYRRSQRSEVQLVDGKDPEQ